MANPVAFPSRPFNLRTYVWPITQDVANNRTKVGWQLWVDKTASSPTLSGGLANRYVKLNGAFVVEHTTPGFNFVSGSTFLLNAGETWITHNADGTMTVAIEAAADFDILGYTPVLTDTLLLTPIARASVATFSAGTSFDAGTALTISTNRASSAFTHTLKFSLNEGASFTTIATGVGASQAWTPPLSLLTQLPNDTSRVGFVRTETYSAGSLIGSRDTVFTLRAGAGVVPTISSLTVADDNPTVASVVGLFVQGLSILKATVNASGAQGSTVVARAFSMSGTSVPSGGSIPVTASGTVALGASVTDSRARTGAWSGALPVLAYVPPRAVTTPKARRATAAGVLSETGTSLRIDLNAAVQSLINSTQRNTLKIEVFTRPAGGTTWTTRNVINHTAITYNSNFVVSGGANYPINASFDVLLKVRDAFNSVSYQALVATSGTYLDFQAAGVGFGKFWERGALDVAGDVYYSGKLYGSGQATHVAATVPTAASGWGIYLNHPSGVEAGSPYVTRSGGFCTVRLTLKNETGADYTFGSGLSVVTGLPNSVVSYFPLGIYAISATAIGAPRSDLGVYVAGTVMGIRGTGTIPAGGLLDIAGIYPIAP